MMNAIRIASTLICAGIMTFPARCQKASQPAPSQLKVVVRADRDTYHISDTMRFETHLVNVGEGDVYVWTWDFCWKPARGLSLHLIAPDGTLAKGKVLLDCVLSPPMQGDPFLFVCLVFLFF